MPYEALTREEQSRIHETALELLGDTGVELSCASLRDRLEERGFQPAGASRLRIPRAVVEEAIRQAPRAVRLGARGAGRSLVLDGTRTYATTDGCGAKTIDFDTGIRRASSLKDLAASARLTDALDEYHVYWTMISAQDVPVETRVPREYLTALQNTAKHVQVIDAATPGEARVLARMARLAAEAGAVEAPAASMLISVVSPLRLDPLGTEAALVFAREGLPVVCTSMPIAGVTAPATSAGVLALAHAELLAFIAVIQSLCPGAPVIYTSYASFADSRTGQTNYGDPRRGWVAGAAAQLGRRLLGLPTFTSGEPLALLGVPDLISGGGLRETSTLLAYEQLVIDAENLRHMRVYAQPAEVGPESLAADVIRQVGPGGHFLAQKHTLRHMKEFLAAPFSADAEAGPRRAHAEARRILERHEVEPLPAGVGSALEEIVQDAERIERVS